MTESIHINPVSEAVSLGQKFKQAREALNLSVEDVAQKTTIKKAYIEALESDIFILQNVSPTFVRGYVRNYLRFLRLPETLAANVNYGEVTIPKEVVHKTSTETVVQKSQSQWVKYLTIIVLLGAIGMTLLWWWQGYQKEQENRDQFVNNAKPVEMTQPNQIQLPVESSAVAPVANVVEPMQNAIESTPLVIEPTVTTTTTMPSVDMSKLEMTKVEMPQMPQVPSVEMPTQPTTEAVNVLQANQNENQTMATTENTAIGNDELRIEITGKESWITVKTPSSKRSLAEKLYTSGEVLTFNGNEQYRLTIGAPVNVKLYYKGQLVPLKIDGRVARIRLPLQ